MLALLSPTADAAAMVDLLGSKRVATDLLRFADSGATVLVLLENAKGGYDAFSFSAAKSGIAESKAYNWCAIFYSAASYLITLSDDMTSAKQLPPRTVSVKPVMRHEYWLRILRLRRSVYVRPLGRQDF